MPPLEAWEKVLVDEETFFETAHGEITCIECHGGVDSDDKAVAHTDLLVDPSSKPTTYCGECHGEQAVASSGSLHTNLAGYWSVLDARMNPTDESAHAAVETMFGNHCGSCHATCGECHVSQPALVGGGLIEGHVFNETPSMTRNCTACHGSRIGKEYLGQHEGLMADVHFRSGRMNCVDCHSGDDMHGHGDAAVTDLAPGENRYTGAQQPRCETCHETVTLGDDGNLMHEQHSGDLSCQVCHSIAYTSCDNCHVAISESTGNPFFETEASYLNFMIGLNPIQSEERPYTYVTVRHIPIDPTSFDFYGENLLEFFSALPTWKYTTPHNIQRSTPQTATCNACHGNADLFLTADKVADGELEANQDVIVEEIPAPIGGD